MILDINKLQEEVNYDKKMLYTNLKLFIENEEPVELRLIKAFDKRENDELYEAAEDLQEMTEFLMLPKLQRKIRDLQMLALHNNMNSALAEKLKDSLIEILNEVKEEINYILNDQKQN